MAEAWTEYHTCTCTYHTETNLLVYILSLYLHWLQSMYIVSEVHCALNELHNIFIHFSTLLSHTNVKGIHTLLWLQSSTIILVRNAVDYHLIKVYFPS